jgi:hypothetical protein
MKLLWYDLSRHLSRVTDENQEPVTILSVLTTHLNPRPPVYETGLLPTGQRSSVSILQDYIDITYIWCFSLRAGRSGDRIPVGVKFSAPVQTGPGAYPASCTMGTGLFPGVKRQGRGFDHPPPSSAEVKERVELYLYFPSGPSWPVLGWTLPYIWCLRGSGYNRLTHTDPSKLFNINLFHLPVLYFQSTVKITSLGHIRQGFG